MATVIALPSDESSGPTRQLQPSNSMPSKSFTFPTPPPLSTPEDDTVGALIDAPPTTGFISAIALWEALASPASAWWERSCCVPVPAVRADGRKLKPQNKKRPRGRAPAGKIWDGVMGQYVFESDTTEPKRCKKEGESSRHRRQQQPWQQRAATPEAASKLYFSDVTADTVDGAESDAESEWEVIDGSTPKRRSQRTGVSSVANSVVL